MLTEKEIKELASHYKTQLALEQYEKLKGEVFGVANHYKRAEFETLKDYLYFASKGTDLQAICSTITY